MGQDIEELDKLKELEDEKRTFLDVAVGLSNQIFTEEMANINLTVIWRKRFILPKILHKTLKRQKQIDYQTISKK